MIVSVTLPDAVFVTVILTVAVTVTPPIHHRDREPGRERDRYINVTLIVTSPWPRYQGHGDVTNISIHQTSFQNYFIWNGKVKNKVTDRWCNVLTNGHSISNGHSNGNGKPWKSWLRLLGDLTFPKKMLFGETEKVSVFVRSLASEASQKTWPRSRNTKIFGQGEKESTRETFFKKSAATVTDINVNFIHNFPSSSVPSGL